MAHLFRKPLTIIDTLTSRWLRINEAWYEFFTLEKRVSIFTSIVTLIIGLVVYLWFRQPFTGAIDITLLMPLFIASVIVVFNAGLLLVLLLILYDTLISSLASNMLTVSAFSSMTVPYLIIIASALFMVARCLCVSSNNRALLLSPITKGLAFMLFTTVFIGLVYHVKLDNQSPSSLVTMTAWLCYFIVITGITSKFSHVALSVSIFVISVIVALATIIQSYFGIDHYLFLKLAARDTRIEQLDGITRVIPQGYLLFFTMIHVSWHMFLTTDSFIKRWGWGLALCIFIGAMIVTMFRNMWVIGGILMVVQFMIVSTNQRIRSIPYLLGISIVLFGTLSVALSSSGSFNPVQAIEKRLSETKDLSLVDSSSSLGSRVDEITQISEMWVSSPLVGIGWGKGYQSRGEVDPLFATFKITQSFYIHNTLWWFLGKSGILGLIGLLTFWTMSLLRCWHIAKTTKHVYTKNLVTALGFAFASICISSMFHPYFSAGPDLILPIALLLGFVEIQNLMTKDIDTETSAKIAA